MVADHVDGVLPGSGQRVEQLRDGAGALVEAGAGPRGAAAAVGVRLEEQPGQGTGRHPEDLLQRAHDAQRALGGRPPAPVLPVAEAGQAHDQAAPGQVRPEPVEGEAAPAHGRAQSRVERPGVQQPPEVGLGGRRRPLRTRGHGNTLTWPSKTVN